MKHGGRFCKFLDHSISSSTFLKEMDFTIRPWRGPRCGSLANVGHHRPQLCGRWHGTRGSLHRKLRPILCGCAASYCGLFCLHAKKWDRPLNASHDDCAWNAGRRTSPYHCPLQESREFSYIPKVLLSQVKRLTFCHGESLVALIDIPQP